MLAAFLHLHRLADSFVDQNYHAGIQVVTLSLFQTEDLKP